MIILGWASVKESLQTWQLQIRTVATQMYITHADPVFFPTRRTVTQNSSPAEIKYETTNTTPGHQIFDDPATA